MATERNVVDFKIHNLTEEQFQELKAQGKIDPNAVYCTPDMTKERLDALETKTTSLESKTTSLDTKTTLLDTKTTSLDTKTTSLENNKQDKGDYATNTALSEGLSQKQDVATAINYDNISNCITEIPQDIKLELNNGTLTLKAGSKVYVPNGAGKFDVVNIAADIQLSSSGALTGLALMFIRTDNLTLNRLSVASTYSGSTQPSSDGYWYDTTNNKIYWIDGGVLKDRGITLPIALISTTNGIVNSIDQVFNGFGYIGSTVFALPGVKGLIPDGRNIDGTLKNTAFTLNKVLTYTSGNYTYTDAIMAYKENSLDLIAKENWYYNQNYNICYQNYMEIGRVDAENGKITASQPKTTFHAVDYNDTEFIAHQAMPSDRYVNLTLGASGESYTAPADGWLVLNKLSSGTSYQYVQLYNTKNADRRIGAATTNNAYLCATMPLAKGDRVLVEYSATGDTKLFRFIYANGAK